MTTLLLIGATGLVGQSVLKQALADPRISRVVALTRRPLPPAARLDNPVVDFEQLPNRAPWWDVDGVICTLGTTIREAGSREAFRKVDLEYPLAVARLARRRGTRGFALTSSIGADPASRSFYLRTKGEVEQGLRDCAFPSLTLVRPSVIGGARDALRPGELLAKGVLRVIAPVLPLRLRVVPAERIAAALLEAAIAAPAGVHIIESEALLVK